MKHWKLIPLLLAVFALGVPCMLIYAAIGMIAVVSQYTLTFSWLVAEIMDARAIKVIRYVDRKFGMD